MWRGEPAPKVKRYSLRFGDPPPDRQPAAGAASFRCEMGRAVTTGFAPGVSGMRGGGSRAPMSCAYVRDMSEKMPYLRLLKALL